MEVPHAFLHRPNLECGTHGLQCSASAFLPFITGGYEYYADDPNSVLPCTVKSFPYLAVHCLQYAQSEFAFEFSAVPHPKNVGCVANGQCVPKDQDNYLLILERIAMSLLHITTFAECVAWARALHDEYAWRIEDIILEHPEDEMENDVPFWSPPKRFPCTKQLAFDWEDELCRRFVISAAVLKARSCGVAVPDTGNIDLQWLQAPSSPLFSQRSQRDKIRIARETARQATDDSAIEAQSAAESDEVRRLVSVASSSHEDQQRFQPIHFNKDDPLHMCCPAGLPYAVCAMCYVARFNV